MGLIFTSNELLKSNIQSLNKQFVIAYFSISNYNKNDISVFNLSNFYF
jgi:hypothetical protein